MWELQRALTDLEAVTITDATFNHYFGSGNIGVIPSLFLCTIVVTAVGQYVYKKTSFGRAVLAVGGSETAARYSGINTGKIKFLAMVICGLTASLAGILYAGRMHGARYTYGENDNMNIIAAVVIGGIQFQRRKRNGIWNISWLSCHWNVKQWVIVDGTERECTDDCAGIGNYSGRISKSERKSK